MRRTLAMTLAFLFVLASAVVRADSASVTSRVVVTSQPVGATVILDGRDRGVTPLTLYGLTPGRHHIKYRLPGYVESDQFFSTDDGPVLEKSASLTEEKGLLLLQTEPEGANVEIDGVSFGQTPRLVTTLPVNGNYTVTFTKTGYQPQKIAVKFKGREPQARCEKLVLDSGSLSFVTEPPGADVTVNGLSRGKSPLVVRDIPKGRVRVLLRLPGYRNEVRDLALAAGEEQKLSVALAPLPGKLFLASEPEGAKFYVNGELRGTAPLTLEGLAPGDYAVRAEKNGYATSERVVTVARGGEVREEFRLSNTMGRLEVKTDPPGATLVFDGKELGRTKERAGSATSDVFVLEDVLEGEHSLVVRLDGYQEVLRHPKIKSGKTSQHSVRLKRLFTPNVEVETVRGKYVGVMVRNTPDNVELEVSLGVTRSFPRSEILSIKSLILDAEKKDK